MASHSLRAEAQYSHSFYGCLLVHKLALYQQREAKEESDEAVETELDAEAESVEKEITVEDIPEIQSVIWQR